MTRLTHLSVWLAMFALIPSTLLRAAAPPSNSEKTPYRVVNGKVDESTFLGWRAYHSACHTCHGPDATGTSIAPSLVERVKSLSARDFTTKVLTSYRIVVPSGEASGDDRTAVREQFLDEVMRRERGELTMPAWEGERNIRPHVLDLYAYLRARADGALGPGKPQRMAD